MRPFHKRKNYPSLRWQQYLLLERARVATVFCSHDPTMSLEKWILNREVMARSKSPRYAEIRSARTNQTLFCIFLSRKKSRRKSKKLRHDGCRTDVSIFSTKEVLLVNFSAHAHNLKARLFRGAFHHYIWLAYSFPHFLFSVFFWFYGLNVGIEM